MTVEEIVREVEEDIDFYRMGEGGVTVSGGEPLLQSKAVAELLKAFKDKGISTLIDTAGDVPWENFERVKEFTDIFYFDFKSGNEDKYSRTVKGNWSRVYENLCRLISEGHDLHVRIPLIPGFNTSEEDRAEICDKLIAAGASQVDLLPFHRLGSGKYEAMGKEYQYKDQEPQSREEIAGIANDYKKYFNITIE
jgi:pyruvate formate lyase activating enzyme